ncbi:MAG: CapA family protein [Agathobacter sp.]|nr:CapA family protein [Agathobacter sp.]MBQ2282908.1 CapA family protein [Agathobacter sp.]
MGKKEAKKLIGIFIGGIVLIIGAIFLIPFLMQNNEDTKEVWERESGISSNTENSEIVKAEDTEINETESTEFQETESEEEDNSLRIVMVGDMLMHMKVVNSGKQEDGTYNFDHLFENVKDTIEEADLAIVNQETILGGEELGYSGYPSFNSPTELGDAEVKAGFDVILHATNHALDKKKNGVMNCMEFWDTNYPDIEYLGINKSQQEQDEDIYVYEENGIKIAILNYTYGTNGIKTPSDMPYLVNYLKEDKIRADVEKAESIADFTIVCPHWGTEYRLESDAKQEKWTKLFFECGVDLVIGTHPHVIEPVEWITDEQGNGMLVYYSIGNFVNGTSSTKGDLTHRMVGGIADVTLERNESGEVVIADYDAIPIVSHVAEGKEFTVYYLSDYTSELAEENLINLQDADFSLEECNKVVDQVWGE